MVRRSTAASSRAIAHSIGLGAPGIPLAAPSDWDPAPAQLRTLGIDPGKRTGWAVISFPAASTPRVVGFGELDPEARGNHLARLVEQHKPALVAIEVVERVHPVRRAGVSGISTDQALALYQAARVVGELAREVQGLAALDEFTAELWRSNLVGAAQADNATIDRVLRLRLDEFPAPRTSNEHERDALGIALFAGLRARLARAAGRARR